jgi:predicted porin
LEYFYMKKTLIALAVLAASGASFAQVTITGEYAYGWNTSNSSAGVETSGLGVDTSFVKFAASEDLGGGLKVAAEMSLDGFTRGAANGGDNSLTLTGGFGKIKLANDKGADYLSSVIGGIAGFDDKVFGARTINDSVAYTSPSFGGLTVGLSHTENASGTNLGVGSASNNDQRSNTLSLSYAAGPLSVTGGFTSYDNQGALATSGAFNGTSKDRSKSRARVKGSYDFGAFTLGAGFLQQQKNEGTYSESIVAVAVPLGALTLGVDVGSSKRENSTIAAADVSKSGYGLKAVYSLSKRTSLIGAYTSWDAAGTQRANLTELLVSHTF